MNNRTRRFAGFAVASLLFCHSMSLGYAAEKGGVSLESTRVVFQEGAKETTLGVSNSLSVPVLVHSSFEQISGEKSNAFMSIPPLFKLDENRTSRLRIAKVAELPQDRESVFFIHVVAIPSGNAKLNIGLGQRIKVFYRPKGLVGDCEYAARNLSWSFTNGKLIAHNPTQLSVSMIDIDVQGKNTKTSMLLPGDRFELPVKLNKLQGFSFRYIDEYGAIRTQEVQLK